MFHWNHDNITEVATLLKQGLSAAQIGAQLGCSRNAVIGKVGRDESLSRIGFAYTRAQHFAGRNPDRIKVGREVHATGERIEWTDGLKSKVAFPLKRGLSASQIGKRMDVSRNAIISIVNRDDALRDIGFTRESYKPKQSSAVAPDPEYTVAKPMLLLGAHDCRWPINDADRDEQHLFCAATKESGKSFCPHHHHRAFDHRRSADV